MKLSLALLFCLSSQVAFSASVFISEFHYDNIGGDTGEFVELYVSTDVNLSDVEFVLYNGSGGTAYTTQTGSEFTVGASVTLSDGDYTIVSFSYPSNGIQNGGSDGMAVGVSGVLCEFLSYEGTLTASGGIADGVTSTDIGISQSNSTTTIGSSLWRNDGGWTETLDTNTQGVANAGLTTNPIPEPSAALLGGLGVLALLRRRR